MLSTDVAPLGFPGDTKGFPAILGWETGIENTLKQQRKNLLAHR